MSRAEKLLPFILAALIPAFVMIQSADIPVTLKWDLLVLRYPRASAVLLIIWFLNQWLLNQDNWIRRIIGFEPSIVVSNTILVLVILLLDHWIISSEISLELPAWMMATRLIIAIVILNVVLRIFRAQRESTSLKVQNLSLQTENLKFQVEIIKQQINPHFLFNSLNTLLDLIEEDKESAIKYVRHFSRIYRTVLQSARHDFISVEDELKFLEDYWTLLKVRFRDAIDLKLDIEKGCMDQLIPPLSLQFLIENAIKHNIASTEEPLSIRILSKDNEILVENKTNPVKNEVISEKVGLENLQQRYTLLHKPIKYGEEEGSFVVRIPLKSH